MLDEPTAVINKTAFRTAGLTAAPVLGARDPPAGAGDGACARSRRAGRRRAAALHARRKRIARWPEGARAREVTMAGTERTDKLTGFEALGLLDRHPPRAATGPGALPEITGLAVDSRDTRAGPSLRGAARQRGPTAPSFIRRRAADGRRRDADRPGRARRSPRPAPARSPVPVILSDHPRHALAIAASRCYGGQPEVMVAVTGTNGKTSVASFTRQILGGARRDGGELRHRRRRGRGRGAASATPRPSRSRCTGCWPSSPTRA